MPKNKPIVVIDCFHLYQALTGIKTYTTQLCSGLEKAEELKASYVFFPDWRKAEQSQFFKGPLSPIKKILSHTTFFFWKQIVLPIYLLRKKADAVVSPDFVAPAIAFGALRMPVFHDVFFWELRDNYNPLWRPYFTRMIEFGIRKRAVIISTSHFTSKKISQFIKTKRPIEVLYQCPKPLLDPIHPIDSSKRGQLDGKDYFLHVGVFDKRKNLEVLVQAYHKYLNTFMGQKKKLILVGERGLSYKHDSFDAVKKLVESLSLQENVEFTGFVDDIELSRLYQGAYAYVFPSLEEGFGIPVLEAMQSQLPLIVSDQGALKEIAGDAALVFDAQDAVELSERLIDMHNLDIRETLITSGQERLKNFTVDRFAVNMDQIIGRALR
jgi:glycosyltransferase involved in cell wall biosynthesis